MNEEIYEKYLLAGKIAKESRDYGISIIKPGVSLLQVANKVESKILEKGANLAFPVNISINEIAAHFSPRHNDSIIFNKGDVVKLDVGTHIDGYIADTATTIEIGTSKYKNLIKSANDGLDVAIDIIKPGIEMSKLGKAVEEKIKSCGYNPIDNLTGHSLQQYILHAGINVPSIYDILNKSKLKVGDVYAIEPFSTNGAGHVVQGPGSNIYLCNKTLRSKLIRDNKAKIMFAKMMNEFKTLPFAERWLNKKFENNDIILRKLTFHGLIKHYPQLIEIKKGIVAQKEHTVIITEYGCEVTT